MTFDDILAASKPTIAFWRGQVPSMGLDPDEVEQELLIKLEDCRKRGELNPPVCASLLVYFKAAARNRVFDMRRSSARNEARNLPLDEDSEAFIPHPTAHRDTRNVEFGVDLERANLSADARRFIAVILHHGARGGRASFSGTIRQFYAARREVAEFLKTRMSKEDLARLLN